ncbi:Hypothetical protein NTJ_16059 [Nesidiocoris tenuis]|uniref:Uncharacterized protein n=1 Tax=Nesidiocoris tenuis TaxID=355587 RepID=A0ABN7BFV2_9HEMI|nr:Hypothetical protein NTJ_16059 [Nesidiocoris tenuis]
MKVAGCMELRMKNRANRTSENESGSRRLIDDSLFLVPDSSVRVEIGKSVHELSWELRSDPAKEHSSSALKSKELIEELEVIPFPKDSIYHVGTSGFNSFMLKPTHQAISRILVGKPLKRPRFISRGHGTGSAIQKISREAEKFAPRRPSLHCIRLLCVSPCISHIPIPDN